MVVQFAWVYVGIPEAVKCTAGAAPTDHRRSFCWSAPCACNGFSLFGIQTCGAAVRLAAPTKEGRTIMAALRAGFITLAALALSVPLHAADHRVDELRSAQDRVARAANSTKGGPQHRLLQEQQKLSGLIDDLENGRHVDPQEIDRALQRAEQGTP